MKIYILSVLVILFPLKGIADRVYWTNKEMGSVWVHTIAEKEGPQELLIKLTDPRGIAVDSGAKRIYVAEHDPKGRIMSFSLDGKDPKVLIDQCNDPADLELCSKTGALYWAEEGSGSIYKIDLKSPSKKQIVCEAIDRPYYLAVESETGSVFFSLFKSGKIYRVKSGEKRITTFGKFGERIRDVEIHNGHLYWTDRESKVICSVSLREAEGKAKKIYSAKDIEMSRPHGLVVVPKTGAVFWTDSKIRAIYFGIPSEKPNKVEKAVENVAEGWGIDFLD